MPAAPKHAAATGSRKSRGARGFERRPWGGSETLEEGPGYKVKRLVVKPGHRISLQRHRFRAEHALGCTQRTGVRLACGSTQPSSRVGSGPPLNSNRGAPPRSWTLLRALRRQWFESSTSVVNGPFPVNIFAD